MSTEEKNVWTLTDKNINELQVASIDKLIARMSAAHFTNLHLRINGTWEIHEGDWLKHLKRVVEPTDQSQLMAFYDVRTKDELIERLFAHIERLQQKLPANGQRAVDRVREG